MTHLSCFLLFSVVFQTTLTSWLRDLNLPRQLLEYHVSSNSLLRQRCLLDSECKINLNSTKCFGFEPFCQKNDSLTSRNKVTKCHKSLNPNVAEKFFQQADFGYLEPRLVKHEICTSSDETSSGSSLTCSDHLTHCIGKNVFFDFSNLNHRASTRYRQNVILAGQVGGKCDHFDKKLLKENVNVKGYLMSWADELQHFESDAKFEMSPRFCDVIFERPTIVMKLDAAVNMYHHFCDFLNLYASLHLNQSFSQDVDVVWWDTHPDGFIDRTYGATWKAFSGHKPIELRDLDQKRVCFKNLMLPMLARQRNGLFYNSPVAQGCSGSALFKSFSQFILHRLGIKPPRAELEKVRIVILSRSTAYRRFLNLKEMLRSLGHLPNVTVRVVDYNERISFVSQLNTTSRADVFIGMHGAGLTHLLFLPDWAAVFEVYNCGDVACYSDLARLRGVEYFTWPEEKVHLVRGDDEGVNPSSGEKHLKFANYHVDVTEFREQVKQMVDHVRRHPKFQNSRRAAQRRQQEAEEQRRREL